MVNTVRTEESSGYNSGWAFRNVIAMAACQSCA